jgi:hypothetical protein
MEVTVTASHGPLRSLPAKLEVLLLLLDGSRCLQLKGDRKRIRLLKVELEQLISEYLMEPSDVDYPAFRVAYWASEVAERASTSSCINMALVKSHPLLLCVTIQYREFALILVHNERITSIICSFLQAIRSRAFVRR